MVGQMIALLVLVGVPVGMVLATIWLLSRKNKAGSASGRSCFSLLVAFGLFRHPIRSSASGLAGLVAWTRRCLGKLETSLNLHVIQDAVAEKREQVNTLDELLREVAGLGLKPETLDAVRGKIKESTSFADGLQDTTGRFRDVLLQLRQTEGEYAKICALACRAAKLGLPQDANDDIEQRLREVGNDLEIRRARFAQEVEFIAGKASRTS